MTPVIDEAKKLMEKYTEFGKLHLMHAFALDSQGKIFKD